MTGIGFGRAIAASRLPAFEQILTDGEDALLTEPGSVEELAAALNRLLEDAPLRERLERGIALRSESFPKWSSIAQSTLDCYRTTLCRGMEARGKLAMNSGRPPAAARPSEEECS